MLRRLTALLALVLVLLPGMVMAQATPEVNDEEPLNHLLPSAALIGHGYMASPLWTPGMTDGDTLREGVGQSYLGDNGQRTYLVLFRTSNDPATQGDAWRMMTTLLAEDAISAPYFIDQDLTAQEAQPKSPAGVVASVRMVGTHAYYPLDVCFGDYWLSRTTMAYVVAETTSVRGQVASATPCDRVIEIVMGRMGLS